MSYNVGDKVLWISSQVPHLHDTGVIYTTAYFPAKISADCYLFLPNSPLLENGMGPLLVLEKELTLIAKSTLGVDLFRKCPNQCDSGCLYCYIPNLLSTPH